MSIANRSLLKQSNIIIIIVIIIITIIIIMIGIAMVMFISVDFALIVASWYMYDELELRYKRHSLILLTLFLYFSINGKSQQIK